MTSRHDENMRNPEYRAAFAEYCAGFECPDDLRADTHRNGDAVNDTLDRAALIAICERAFVPENRWYNRDSSAAQRQLGECYALLKAGCSILGARVERETIWVTIEYRGFDYFEGTYDGRGTLDDDRFYLPTPERLEQAEGGDWY